MLPQGRLTLVLGCCFTFLCSTKYDHLSGLLWVILARCQLLSSTEVVLMPVNWEEENFKTPRADLRMNSRDCCLFPVAQSITPYQGSSGLL